MLDRQDDPLTLDAAAIREEGHYPAKAGNPDDLRGDHLLITGVHQFIRRTKKVALHPATNVVVEAVALHLIPYDLQLTGVEPVEGADLMASVGLLGLAALQVEPGPLLATPQGYRPTPQAVAQYAHCELS